MSKADGCGRAGDGRDPQEWVARYGDLVSWIRDHDEMPREQTGGTSEDLFEAHLGGWVRYQRRRFVRGNLPGWQRVLLEQVKLFSFDPFADLWIEQVDALREFLVSHRRVPRARSDDPVERALGAWVHKQRHLYRSRRLSADRIAVLRQLPIRIV
jgi:hypothetical protein